MNLSTTRWLLFSALFFLAPVPFFLAEVGRVPPARLFQLTGGLVALIAAEGGRGAVGPAALLIGSQAVVYAGAAFVLAGMAARPLGRLGRLRAALVAIAVVACGLTAALLTEPYVSPFSIHASASSLAGVFR